MSDFQRLTRKQAAQHLDDPHDAVTLVMTSVLGSVEFKWEYNRKQ